MYKKELLDTIKKQGKGLIYTVRDYKIIFESSKVEAEKENRKYDYSKVYSIVYDGKKSVKITYTEVPTTNISPDHDPLKEFTDFRYKTLTLDEINNLTFVK